MLYYNATIDIIILNRFTLDARVCCQLILMLSRDVELPKRNSDEWRHPS